MLNLISTVDLDFMAFLRWWRRELGLLVPEKVKRLVTDKQGFIIITPELSRLHFSVEDDGERRFLTSLERTEGSAAMFQQRVAQDESLAKAAVILRLPVGMGLVRELSFPVAAKENLQQVIAYELDRYTPFKADQVYFAVRPSEGPQEPGLIKVSLVLTPRESLDALYEDVRAIGLLPVFADYEGVPNLLQSSRNRYNLLPEKYRQKTPQIPFIIHTSLMVLACWLFIGVLVLPVWFQYQTVEALTERVKGIEKEAKKIKLMQGKVDEAINETQKLLDEKTDMPMMVAVLDALSSLMKDDTSLDYLQFSDGHLQIQGQSPSASTLIGVLEASELFNNARFVSPVTQDNVSKLERFQITVDISKKSDGHEKTL